MIHSRCRIEIKKASPAATGETIRYTLPQKNDIEKNATKLSKFSGFIWKQSSMTGLHLDVSKEMTLEILENLLELLNGAVTQLRESEPDHTKGMC